MEGYKAGDRLPNGAIVLDFTSTGKNEGVVLAHWNGDEHKFVTWVVGPTGDTFWGNYFSSITDAANDYARRVNK